MKVAQSVAVCSVVSAMLAGSRPATAQSAPEVALAIDAGRPLDVVVDDRVVIKRVGQAVDGLVVQDVYAYDRLVVPAGTKVIGHVAELTSPPKVTRIRAWLSGDLTPAKRVVLQFDLLMLPSGESVPIQTVITAEIPRMRRSSAPPVDDDPEPAGGARRLEREARNRARTAIADARQRGRDVLAEITQPGRLHRLRDAVVERLPYHPQVIAAGTGYHAELLARVDFGTVAPTERAPAAVQPTPSSLLRARLLTALDSAKTPRGTKIQAAVTEPVFSADHQLIVPEGTVIEGEVTLASPARRLHRNGQLRFLFESVPRAADASTPLLASLHAIDASGEDRLTIDDEGGTTLDSSKTRFIMPALALLALRGNFHSHDHLDPDGDGHIIHSGNPGARGTGGFFGLGILGIGLSQISRPLGAALSVVGAARTLYSNVLGRGREVQFSADTAIQLQLAPGAAVER